MTIATQYNSAIIDSCGASCKEQLPCVSAPAKRIQWLSIMPCALLWVWFILKELKLT
ncbi:MAG: hypothetical protein OFPI_43030 [Osedax symbiont Rs2]|nr:MAG: hypothetical protein OFPI_43030 [Osedax symbiont Rs2]